MIMEGVYFFIGVVGGMALIMRHPGCGPLDSLRWIYSKSSADSDEDKIVLVSYFIDN